MELDLVLYPDPVLTTRTHDIAEIDDSVRELADSMLKLMEREFGIGLAAPQVGHSVRLLVVACKDEGIEPQALINPRIVSKKGECVIVEGCLSFPGIHAPVKRAEEIKVVAQDLEGKEIEIETGGLFARVLQHEMDHLDGLVFIQHFSPVQRIKWRSALKDLEARYKRSTGK